MYAIDNAEAQYQKYGMFKEMAEGCAIADYIYQIATGTVNGQKRE